MKFESSVVFEPTDDDDDNLDSLDYVTAPTPTKGEMNWDAVKDDSFRDFFTTSALDLPKEVKQVDAKDNQGFWSALKTGFLGLFRNDYKYNEDDSAENSSLFFPGDEVRETEEFIADDKAFDTQDLSDQTLQFDLSLVNDPIAHTQEIYAREEETQSSHTGKINFVNASAQGNSDQKPAEQQTPNINNFEIIEPIKKDKPEIEDVIAKAQEELEIAKFDTKENIIVQPTLDVLEEIQSEIIFEQETALPSDEITLAQETAPQTTTETFACEITPREADTKEIGNIYTTLNEEIVLQETVSQSDFAQATQTTPAQTLVFDTNTEAEQEDELDAEAIGEISFDTNVELSAPNPAYEINIEPTQNYEPAPVQNTSSTNQEFLGVELEDGVKQNAEEKAAEAVLKLFGTEEAADQLGAEFETLSPFEESAPKHKTEKSDADKEDLLAVAKDMQSLCAVLNLRIALIAVLSFGMLILGLMAQGALQAVEVISPEANTTLFLWVNIILLVAVMGISYNTIIEGVLGLWKKPSTDTLPTIAAIASLLQLLVLVLSAKTFAADTANAAIFASVAGLLLLTNTIGNRILAGVVYNNYNCLKSGLVKYAAYRLNNKEIKRALASNKISENSDILLSCPAKRLDGFLEQSFSDRINEKQMRLLVYGFISVAFVAGFITLIRGDGFIGFVSGFSAVLCIGAPLSSSLISALPCLFMQKASMPMGAVIPGWKSVDELGKVDVINTEAKEIFPAGCAELFGIKTFQKERLDMAILYATSILIEACDLLSDLFANMIEHKMEMLYPVKDLENRRGLGFVAWCENYRVILGTRELMEQEGVALPPMDYEERYSKSGIHQVMYLAVSGQLYAMFLIGYKGERSVAKAMRALRKENIRLMVKCDDPSLTAKRIERIYRLPAGFIHVVSSQEAKILKPLTAFKESPKGAMMHTGHFISFASALKAATGADGAQRSAAAVQIISILISAFITLFLALFGGLIGVSLIAAILYQTAWSALSLGLVFTKKFT